MSKADDINDLLGDTPAPKAKKAAAKAPAKEEAKAKAPAKKAAAKEEAKAPAKAPAKKAAAKEEAKAPAKAPAKKAAAVDADKPKRQREPLEYAEGEREDLLARAAKLVKKPINSRDLAEKLGTTTRKLRPVLYTLKRQGKVTLTTGESRTMGMTVVAA